MLLNINAEGGVAEDLGTIHFLLQISSTNVEVETESNPVDMDAISRRYVSSCLIIIIIIISA